jgi:hypothetical protein
MLFNLSKNTEVTVSDFNSPYFDKTGKIKNIEEKRGFKGFKYFEVFVIFKDDTVEKFKEWNLFNKKD